MREEVREVLPGSVPVGGGPAGDKLLTLEQLAALEKASAAAGGRGDAKAHKAKVCRPPVPRATQVGCQQVRMADVEGGVQGIVWSALFHFTVHALVSSRCHPCV